MDIQKINKLNKKIFGIEWGEEDKRIPIPHSIKQEILFKQKGKCAECGLDFMSEGIIPEIHHKDGNPANSKLSNLEALCPNCHRKKTHKQFLTKSLKKKSRKPKDSYEELLKQAYKFGRATSPF